MSESSAEAVSASILEIISQSPQQSISGSKLISQLRLRHPDFNVQLNGCTNFRAFIRRFLPQVTESQERAGMDIIYVLKAASHLSGKVEGPQLEQIPKHTGFVNLLLSDPRAWKTFASPQSTSKLFVKPDGSEVIVSSAQAAPIGEWLRIDPISANVLLQIAKDFIETVPELFGQPLTQSLSEPRWWMPFFELTGSLGLKSRWVMFRRRRIIDEFLRSVKERPEVTTHFVRDDSDRRSFEQSGRVVGQVSTTVESGDAAKNLQSLRDLAVFAVQRMSDAELRSLVIQLGYVADALHQKP